LYRPESLLLFLVNSTTDLVDTSVELFRLISIDVMSGTLDHLWTGARESTYTPHITVSQVFAFVNGHRNNQKYNIIQHLKNKYN